MANEILFSNDSDKVTAIVLLDLFVAFNNIENWTLLSCLQEADVDIAELLFYGSGHTLPIAPRLFYVQVKCHGVVQNSVTFLRDWFWVQLLYAFIRDIWKRSSLGTTLFLIPKRR